MKKNMIKHSFGQQIVFKSYQMTLENAITEVKSMFKTWNIGLIPNEINIVSDSHLLCVICIYKTTDYFFLTCFKFFCRIVLLCVSRMSLQTKHCHSLNIESE